ncbi:ASCH domain-containing protein [Agarilytica rhodophyticola]|uniref:ASCH domain-containing protein n=1 Tax=Agarilytica rhodophyticola TaxID=1737490 RepID=UPI000B344FA2|nr:ASCH domain-containing protein [Agarilytica rhodophyticola]
MKALSIKQPWAWLIVNGYKDVENRSWKYKPGFTGGLLIHASKGCTKKEYSEAVAFAQDINPNINIPSFECLEKGGIVGCVFMEGVVTRSCSRWFTGPLGFAFSKAEVFPFTPCVGQLGFFEPNFSEVLV